MHVAHNNNDNQHKQQYFNTRATETGVENLNKQLLPHF